MGARPVEDSRRRNERRRCQAREGGGNGARHRKLKEVASDDAEVPSSRIQGDVDSLLAFACLHTLPSLPCPFHLRLFRFPFIARRFFPLCLFSFLLFFSLLFFSGDAAGFHLCSLLFPVILFLFFFCLSLHHVLIAVFISSLLSPSFLTGLSSHWLRSISLTRFYYLREQFRNSFSSSSL